MRRLVNDFEWLVMQSIAEAEMGTNVAGSRLKSTLKRQASRVRRKVKVAPAPTADAVPGPK